MEDSSIASFVWCCAQSIIFVSSLYVLVPSEVRALPRNAPRHIQYRAFALCVATCICGIGTWSWFADRDQFKWLLFSGLNIHTTFVPLLSYVILFLGPIAQLLLIPSSIDLNIGCGLWIDLRNLLIAPITEELVFRAFMGATVVSRFSTAFVVFGLPCFFGVAHVHHGILRVQREECDVRSAALTALFQTLYTTFFGALMMRCLLATRNVLSIILIHTWCNLMGFPAFNVIFDASYSKVSRFGVAIAYVLGILLFYNFDSLMDFFV